MSFTVEVDLGGIKFSATEDSVEALLKQYEQMKGDSGWLLRKVQETVPLAEAGKLAVSKPSWLEDPEFGTEAQGSAEGGDAWSQDGPWNATGSTESAQKRDPWDNTPVSDSKPAQRRSAPQRPAQEAATSAGAATEVDRWGNEWTFNLPDAPGCEHGEAAARVKAKAGPNAKRPGSIYTQWRCARGGPGRDFNSKCEFKQFPN